MMKEKTLSIPNISCGHCVMAIKNELGRMDGVEEVTGNPEDKKITVIWELPATIDKIEAALSEINYPAV